MVLPLIHNILKDTLYSLCDFFYWDHKRPKCPCAKLLKITIWKQQDCVDCKWKSEFLITALFLFSVFIESTSATIWVKDWCPACVQLLLDFWLALKYNFLALSPRALSRGIEKIILDNLLIPVWRTIFDALKYMQMTYKNILCESETFQIFSPKCLHSNYT